MLSWYDYRKPSARIFRNCFFTLVRWSASFSKPTQCGSVGKPKPMLHTCHGLVFDIMYIWATSD